MRHKSFAMSTLLVSAALVPTGALAKSNKPLPNCNAASLGAAVQAIVPNILPGSITAGLPTNGATGSCLARPQSPAPGPTPFVTLAPINAVNAGVNVIGPCSAAQDSAGQQTPVGPTPEYCQVAFTYYPGGSGANNPGPGLQGPGVPNGQPAYNDGEQQAVEIQISLPLNSADGGSGGIEGNWTGGILTGGSPGSSGSLSWAAFTDGIDMGGPTYAIRQGFVASETDTGQTAAAAANAGSTNFAIIPSGVNANKIAYGTVADWIYRGTHYGKQWADAIAEIYYGEDPRLHYYNGCSGGGNQGMGQLQNYGDEYDGILIGAPAYRWQQFRLADSWPNLVMRKLVQLDGTGALLTSAQASNLNSAILAACDVEGTDTVKDGLIADPRVCTLKFSAQSQVCGVQGAPAAPACLATTDQAAAVDRVWDGPRNSQGARLWYPYDISIPLGGGGFSGFSLNSVALSGSTVQVVQWNHANSKWDANDCLFVDQASANAGTTNLTGLGIKACGSNGPGISYLYEQEQYLGSTGTPSSIDSITHPMPPIDVYSDNENPDLTKARDHRTKVIQIRGMADPAIRWRHDVDYYNRVAVKLYGHQGDDGPNYTPLLRWYRFFPAPSVGHCGGGAGPQWVDPFLALRNWVEKGTDPDFLVGLTGTAGVDPGRTRPLCPFPQTAIYNGSGSTDDYHSYHCGGNLEANRAVVCNDVKTRFGRETTAELDFRGVGLSAEECGSDHDHDRDHDGDHRADR